MTTSRDRLIAALEHREPDRVPYDLGATHVSGIHAIAYRNLRRHLTLPDLPLQLADLYQQAALPDADILELLQVDTRGLFPLCSHNWHVPDTAGATSVEHTDEWGFTQRFAGDSFWWSQTGWPLPGDSLTADDITKHQWPNAALPERIKGLRAQAEAFRAQGKVVVLKGLCAGMFEMGQRVRGMENFLCDLMVDPSTTSLLLDKINALKMAFWEMALNDLGDVVDIVVENDDYGTQESQLIPPETFRELFKPRLAELFALIKNKLRQRKPAHERGWIFFHSCGNVRPILPDFIEIGVDILNPVHVNAAGMEPVALKRDFGSAITFWGGGVETQNILPRGTPQEVADDVKRNLDALMPGGGYVFNTVHNIQPEAPPANIMAMWHTLQEYGQN